MSGRTPAHSLCFTPASAIARTEAGHLSSCSQPGPSRGGPQEDPFLGDTALL